MPNRDDMCPGTGFPDEVPTEYLKANHYALLEDGGEFTTTVPNGQEQYASYTLADTAGCSCIQILENLDLVCEPFTLHGCTVDVMEDWLEIVRK